MKQTQPFNSLTVPLSSSNLIEASAGTGKTYSIAILFLRLLLEKKMNVSEILMVTFTKAAVAELEERIRLFVRSAYKVSLGEKIQDETITGIVKGFADAEVAKEILKDAVLLLDETSVLTIHSFCQKTLTEFAFETGQQFGVDTLQDIGGILDEETNKFWRSHITTIPPGLLKQLLDSGLSRDSIKQTVKEHLGGKKYSLYDPTKSYSSNQLDHQQLTDELNALRKEEGILRQDLDQYIIQNSKQLQALCEGDSNAKRNLLQLVDKPPDFINYVVEKRKSAYIQMLFQDILDKCDACDNALNAVSKRIGNIISLIKCMAITHVTVGMQTFKMRNNQMSFDDMIVNLHKALHEKTSGRLVAELRKKYKAVFIDEFQDTDKLQYELFQAAFDKETIVFYIGDPKQSIYAWRKADIFTYFKAYASVKNVYDMNVNFRSSSAMIEAMNSFFKPHENFDTFYFDGADHSIQYISVTSPAKNVKGLWVGKKTVVPMSIMELPKNGEIISAVTGQIVDLLENVAYRLDPRSEQTIRPSDIGILVRSNRQGRDIKAALAKYGIPAVTIGDDKVFQSDEAEYVLYILEAMLQISKASINKALLSPYTGFTTKDILQLNDEKALGLFKKYKLRWDEDGIYTTLSDFISDFNVQSALLGQNRENGERIITNLFQISELLHKVQTTKAFSPTELTNWLKRAIEGMETEGDEYEQRMESDEEAITIVTIHKSKGLEYNIVLAPFLDLTVNKPKSNEDPVKSFREEKSGDYICMEWSGMSADQRLAYANQEEQEYRRLIYVAITRAVNKCYVYRNLNYKASSLASFTDEMINTEPSLIEKAPASNIPTGYRFRKTPWQPIPKIENVLFKLKNETWGQMSYTRLAAKQDVHSSFVSVDHENTYDQFIFRQLVRGETTGNMLHQLFETIHFSNDKDWPKAIASAISRYAPIKEKVYEKALGQLIKNVLTATIPKTTGTFMLSDIEYKERIHEFEFDFPVTPFLSSELSDLTDEHTQLRVRSLGEIEGIMNGKIDMFFKHDNKYYIVDWKSNYLGADLTDYGLEGVARAMNDNNYHLQYLIYTVAIKKYLETRVDGFDYERDFGGVYYLFVRGMRGGSSNGIFFR